MANKLNYTLKIGLMGLALTSCVSTSTSWKRDGTTPEEFAIDKETCQSLARREVEEKYINSTKSPSKGGINNELSYHTMMQQYDARRNIRKTFERCLALRGYKKINPITNGEKVQKRQGRIL